MNVHLAPWPQARARSGCWITFKRYDIFLPSLVYLDDMLEDSLSALGEDAIAGKFV